MNCRAMQWASHWRGILVLLLAWAGQPAHAAETELVLHGRLQADAHQSYRQLPFELPPGTGRITVEFDYTGRDQKTTIDLGLLDPQGLRGWSGGNKRLFTVSASDATPSYLPGTLPAGTWALLLGVPNIRPGSVSEYKARIRFTLASAPEQLPESLAPVLKAEPGWYRGDLHMHTGHSDASCSSHRQQRVPCPLFMTAQHAVRAGLDFVAITDHNTSAHFHDIRGLQPFFDDVLLMTGMEVTTFQGHANVFGLQAGLDFRVGSNEVPDWNALLAETSRRGLLASINHPQLPSDERCMGCGWTPRQPVEMALMGAVEVVNGGDADTPVSGIGFWHRQLDAGYRLTGIGGSDNHDAGIEGTRLGASRIGAPTTVVHAQALSQAGILQGLRAGRVFVDVQGTSHRHLDMHAKVGDRSACMGGDLSVAAGESVEIRLRIADAPGARVELWVDGQPSRLLEASVMVGEQQEFAFAWPGDGRRHWIRADVRGADGGLHLVGNPVTLNFGGVRTPVCDW